MTPSSAITRGSAREPRDAAGRGRRRRRPRRFAPRCSSTSVKPPVLWPTSRHVMPVTSIARARQRAVELQAAARDEAQLGVVGDLDVGAGRTGPRPPSPATRQPAAARQRTAPVAISRCAADRVGARPRSTSSWSARIASSPSLSSGRCRACTALASARRCRRPARRSARSASRRPSSGAGARPSRRGASAGRRPCRRRRRRCA